MVAATTGLILGLLLVLVSSPVAAQDEDVSEDTEAGATDRSAEQVIQVLDVVEGDDGEVIMDVAVPGVIGDLPLALGGQLRYRASRNASRCGRRHAAHHTG